MQRLLLALAFLSISGICLGQYPAKPIRFIVGFPPGGSADPTTRIIGQALSDQVGQPVIVENRPGADSALAAEQMTRIAPDGYTIMFASNSAMTARWRCASSRRTTRSRISPRSRSSAVRQ